jgi:ElaB/YqjD/DUF883 family membrane-anchored ribosome-binding protein
MMASAPSTQQELLKQQDELLKELAAEAVKQGANLRKAVRDLTLQGLQLRELTLDQIKRVVRNVTEGVNLGVAEKKLDAGKALEDALAGMDDALLKTVQATRVVFERLGTGKPFEETPWKQAFHDLEQLEDVFLTTLQQTTDTASEEIRKQWATVLNNAKISGTETGEQVAATVKALRDFGERMRDSTREWRKAGFKAAYLLTENFATLASGVLMGLSEGLQGEKRVEPEEP